MPKTYPPSSPDLRPGRPGLSLVEAETWADSCGSCGLEAGGSGAEACATAASPTGDVRAKGAVERGTEARGDAIPWSVSAGAVGAEGEGEMPPILQEPTQAEMMEAATAA